MPPETNVPARPVPQHAPGLISRELDGEFVVLQTATNQAHALSGAAGAVWRGTVDDLTDAEYDTAVSELRALGLLLDDKGGLSRRTMIKRAGIVAAGVGVASIVLPMASAAASENNGATPAILLSPTSGPKGTDVTVTGTGFAVSANRQIQSVTIGGVTVTPSNTTIDASGNASFTFTVPAGAPTGLDTVVVTDNHHNSASATFTVSTPSVTLSATTFAKNSSPKTFTVTASSGFFPSTGFTITTDGTNFTSVTPNSGTTTAGGGIPNPVGPPTTYSVAYASGANKAGTITFTDSKGNTATVNVTTGP